MANQGIVEVTSHVATCCGAVAVIHGLYIPVCIRISSKRLFFCVDCVSGVAAVVSGIGDQVGEEMGLKGLGIPPLGGVEKVSWVDMSLPACL